jgi:hypothetical protein
MFRIKLGRIVCFEGNLHSPLAIFSTLPTIETSRSLLITYTSRCQSLEITMMEVAITNIFSVVVGNSGNLSEFSSFSLNFEGYSLCWLEMISRAPHS